MTSPDPRAAQKYAEQNAKLQDELSFLNAVLDGQIALKDTDISNYDERVLGVALICRQSETTRAWSAIRKRAAQSEALRIARIKEDISQQRFSHYRENRLKMEKDLTDQRMLSDLEERRQHYEVLQEEREGELATESHRRLQLENEIKEDLQDLLREHDETSGWPKGHLVGTLIAVAQYVQQLRERLESTKWSWY